MAEPASAVRSHDLSPPSSQAPPIVRGETRDWRRLTRLLELPVVGGPGVLDLQQAVLHGPDVGVGAVALWEGGAALAPAVVLLADELALRAARCVAERRGHKALAQVLREQHLQA